MIFYLLQRDRGGNFTMLKLNLRQLFCTVVSSAGLLLATCTASAETWRMAFKAPLDSPDGKIFARFAELVDE